MDIAQQPFSDNVDVDKFHFVNDWFLMGSPYSIALILSTYLLFVLKIGPEYMKNRKPYKLQTLLLVYNAVQVYLSMRIMSISYAMLSKHGLLPKTCVTETSEQVMQLASGMHYYFLVKVGELLDTVFFVLRKKDNQVTFLHVYHHTLVAGATWVFLQYEPSYLVTYLGWINSLVHVIMYTYYGLAAFPSLRKYLWWKKYITRLQLIQFATIILHYFVLYKTSDCKPSTAISVTYLFNLSLFLYLFGKFYVNSYMKKNEDKKQADLAAKNKKDEEETIVKQRYNNGTDEQRRNRNRTVKGGH